MNFINRFLATCCIAFVFCAFCLVGNMAQAAKYSHHTSGVCSDFMDNMSNQKRREFAHMHSIHLEQMRPLYTKYTKIEHALNSSKYHGYGYGEALKKEKKALKEQKKEVEKEIYQQEKAFAKEVQERFGKKLKVSRRHVIRHGIGRGAVCGFVGGL